MVGALDLSIMFSLLVHNTHRHLIYSYILTACAITSSQKRSSRWGTGSSIRNNFLRTEATPQSLILITGRKRFSRLLGPSSGSEQAPLCGRGGVVRHMLRCLRRDRNTRCFRGVLRSRMRRSNPKQIRTQRLSCDIGYTPPFISFE
jgi:hypothetical protein